MAGLFAVAVGAGLGVAAGIGWSTLQSPVYLSTATLMVSVPTGDERTQYEALRGRSAVAPMLASIAATPATVSAVAGRLGIAQDAEQLIGSTSARADPGRALVAIAVRHGDPRTAAAVANGLATDLAARTRSADATGGSLTLIAPAVPASTPETPVEPLNAALGGVVGATVVAAALFAWRARSRLAGAPPAIRRSSIAAPSSIARRPSGIGLGILLGLLLLGAIGLRLPTSLIAAIAGVAVVISAASPGAGFAILVLVLPEQEPAALGALGVKLPVIAAVTWGILVRMTAARAMPRLSVGIVVVAGYTALAAVSAVPFLTGLDGDRAVASVARFVQLAECLALVAVGAVYFARHDPRPHLALSVGSAGLVAALALLELIPGGTELPLASGLVVARAVDTVARAAGPFENPNYLSLFLGFALILALGLGATDRRWRPYVVPFIPLLAMGIASTLSRGSLAAAVCGVLALVWFRSRMLATTVAIALVVAGTLVYPTIIATRLERSATGGIASGEAGLAESDAQRLDAVAAGLRIFGIDPVFGAGFGQYEFVSTRFVGSSAATAAHNQYLKVLAEQGLVGAVLGAATIVVLARALRRSSSPLRPTVLAMATTYVVAGAFLEPLTTVQASGVMALAAAAVLGGAALPERGRVRLSARPAFERAPVHGVT